MISQLNQTLQGVTDATQAQAIGMHYLMGTDWFKTTFPGYESGLTAGLYTDPNGYRSYVNDLNVLSQQYNGRNIGGDEVAAYLAKGYSSGYVANLFQGQAYVKANTPELQYEGGAFGNNGPFTQDQLTALGNENAGIDSALGQQIKNQVDIALKRMSKAFSGGAPANPSLTIGGQGLNSPSAAGQKVSASGGADVGA